MKLECVIDEVKSYVVINLYFPKSLTEYEYIQCSINGTFGKLSVK